MRKTLKTDLISILILIFVAIGIQFIFLNPPILSDQMEYYITAVRFPHLPSNPNIGSMRIGLELPVALLYRIFGTSEVAYYTVPILSAALLSVSIYLIGKSLFSRRVGFFSGLWVIFIPNLVQDAGHLLPDLPATACSAAAFAVLFAYFGDKERKRDFSSKSSLWIFILTGLLFGWSYLIKEYLAILFLLIPLVFGMLEFPYRHLLPVAISMLLMYGIEVAVGIIYYRNPLIRFLAASPRETTGEIQKDVSRIVNYFALLLIKEGGEGILALMGLGVLNSLLRSFRKQKSHIFLLTWVLLIYVLFTFAGLLPVIFNWEGIVLLRLHKFRYWVPILPPLVIGAVAMLDAFFAWLKGHLPKVKISENAFVTFFLVVFLTLTAARGINSIKNDPDFIRNGADQYLELRAYLKANDNPNDIIWIDRGNKRAFERILPMYIRNPFGKLIWHGSTKYINTDNLYLRADEIDQGYIIVDRDFMTPSSSLPSYLYDAPDGWLLVFESENKKLALYKVD
jgi:4-amino-4-deoxy-L-arabinose transferase-like glycosyltransferase